MSMSRNNPEGYLQKPLTEKHKSVKYDPNSSRYTVKKEYFASLMPQVSPYKDCLMFNQRDKLNLIHETNLNTRLEKLDGSLHKYGTLNDFTKQEFSPQQHLRFIQDQKVLPKEKVKYCIEQAHNKIIDSRPLSPKTMDNLTHKELFGQDKQIHIKKKLNYVNFSENHRDIINDTPLHEKYGFYKDYLDKRVQYERPQVSEDPQFGYQVILENMQRLRRNHDLKKIPIVYKNINNIKTLQKDIQLKLDKINTNPPSKNKSMDNINRTQKFRVDKFYNYDFKTISDLTPFAKNQSAMNNSKYESTNALNRLNNNNSFTHTYEPSIGGKSSSSQYIINRLEDQIKQEIKANNELKREVLQLWQIKKQRHKTPFAIRNNSTLS